MGCSDLPLCQHVIFGIATCNVLRILMTFHSYCKLIYAPCNVVIKLPRPNLSFSGNICCPFEALDNGVRE